MTLIESLALAALHGFSRFVPISSEAHETLLQRFLHFPSTTPEWRTTFALGALIALLLYFIHDWASILSSLIQVAVYRKKPMTLDERVPFFMLFCMAIPFAGLWLLVRQSGMETLELIRESHAHWIAGALAVSSVLLHLSSRWSKKNKGLFDLGVIDSLLFGVGQAISWIPGVGGTLGILGVSQLRNYHLEAATKIACLMSLPFLGFEALGGVAAIQWGTSEPFSGTSWYQWGFTLLISMGAALLALRVLNDQIRQSGFGRLLVYRIILAAVLTGIPFFR
jgi:undecaprenyl-diphosphatase